MPPFISLNSKILSRASEMGSPTNHLGSRQLQDTGQGSSSPLTGGWILTHTGEPPTCTEHNTYTKYLDKVNLMINYQKLNNTDWLHWTRFTKAGWAWHITISPSKWDVASNSVWDKNPDWYLRPRPRKPYSVIFLLFGNETASESTYI